MRIPTIPTAAAAALALTSALLVHGAAAQEAATEAERAQEAMDALDLSTGAEAQPGTGPEVGRTYVREQHGDWEMRCVRTEDGLDPCQLYQLLQDQQGNAVAEISVFDLPEGSQVAAGATIITPLETLLTEQLVMAIDGAAPKRYPFSWCSAVGCFARVGFTAAEVGAFQRGNVARLTIVPVVAPDQTVDLDVSLAGFTAGLAAVEANQDAVAASQPTADPADPAAAAEGTIPSPIQSD